MWGPYDTFLMGCGASSRGERPTTAATADLAVEERSSDSGNHGAQATTPVDSCTHNSQVAVFCVRIVSCAGLPPGRHGAMGRYFLVELLSAAPSGCARRRTAVLDAGASPQMTSPNNLIFQLAPAALSTTCKVRILLMDDSSGISDHAGAVVIDPLTSLQLLGDSAAAAATLQDDRARHLKGFVGSVEVLLNHAQVHKRWKLAQTVAFVSHRGDHVGSCRILMRWDPLAGQTPPAVLGEGGGGMPIGGGISERERRELNARAAKQSPEAAWARQRAWCWSSSGQRSSSRQ